MLYSDSCAWQNRNATLFNAINDNVNIEKKYLENGHTQMEANSMHSIIERNMRKTDRNLPADYVQICVRARENLKSFIS